MKRVQTYDIRPPKNRERKNRGRKKEKMGEPEELTVVEETALDTPASQEIVLREVVEVTHSETIRTFTEVVIRSSSHIEE